MFNRVSNFKPRILRFSGTHYSDFLNNVYGLGSVFFSCGRPNRQLVLGPAGIAVLEVGIAFVSSFN